MSESARVLRADELADSPEQWPIAEHRLLATGSVSDFVEDEVVTPHGQVMRRQYTLHPGAVGVIALDADDRIAVVVQYRHPVAHRLVPREAPCCPLRARAIDYADTAVAAAE